MQQGPSWEAESSLASQEIPRILWSPKFHYGVHNSPPPVPILSQINPFHVPHHTSWRFILILSSHLRLGLPSGLFPSGFPTKSLYTPLLSPHTCYMPRPSQSSRFYHPNNIWWVVEIIGRISSSCSFLHYCVTSPLLGPNILLNTLFSNTLSLSSSLNGSDQVSHPYKTTGKIIVLILCT